MSFHTIIEKQHFDVMHQKEYFNTEFKNCTFSSISLTDFSDCKFTACDLSNCQVMGTGLQDVTFTDCKLMGITFYEANDFGFAVHCTNCVLDYCSFDNKKMNNSSFDDCRIHGASFREADLSRVKLKNCDFLHAIFAGTNLFGVNFTTSTNISMDLSLNKVKKTKFSAASLGGLLGHFDIIIE